MEYDIDSEICEFICKGKLDKVKKIVSSVGLSHLKTWQGGYMLLFWALSYNQINIAKWLLSQNCQVNPDNPKFSQKTVLHLAIGTGKAEVVKILLKKGASVTVSNDHLETPLHISCKNRKPEVLLKNDILTIIKLLLKHGAPVNAKGGLCEETPLLFAMKNKHQCGKIVKLLLTNGANVNDYDMYRKTALHIAVENGDKKMIKLLLEHNADVNVKNCHGRTPLHLAVRGCCIEIAKMLIVNGADVNDIIYDYEEYRWTPLHIAVKNKDEKMIKILLDYSANVNAKEDHYRTPLHIASVSNSTEIVKILLFAGADINDADKQGQIPFHLAIRIEDEKMVEFLLEHNANVHAKRKDGKSCLHFAAENRSANIAKLLLNKGANINQTTLDGRTVLHFAAKKGSKELVELFLKLGMDVDVKTKIDNFTPLYYAVKKRHCQIAEYLLYHGADVNIPVKFYQTLLRLAVYDMNKEMVELLLNWNANINEEDSEDESPLLIATDSPRYEDIPGSNVMHGITDCLIMYIAKLVAENTYIKEQRYSETIQVLTVLLDHYSSSRQCLSLLAYCYYYTQDFLGAANCYEKLVHMCPDEAVYKLYHAQSLHQACMYQEAWSVCAGLSNNPSLEAKVKKLQAAIKYGEEDTASAKSYVDQCPPDDVDTEINFGCLLYQEGEYEQALKKFSNSLQVAGFRPHLSYNVALCYYKLKEYAASLKHIADIIEQGIREHPELSVGMTTEGIEVRSVGNTLTLHETALTEAFNLKAAIEYQLKNIEAAKEALTDMPPRSEEELDAVTLHNQALINMDTKPNEGFEKMQFLLQQNPFPPETFPNILLMYCKYQYYDLAADVLAENTDFTFKYLSPYLYSFLDALIVQQTSPEEAYKKFDDLATELIEMLRKATKQVQEARLNHDENASKKAVNDYEDALEKYLPVLMAQAKIFWDLGNYTQVEKIFKKSLEFCNEHEIWKLNLAHTIFMQESKFKDAIAFYAPIVKKKYDNILDVSAIVLSNLCVSYIMTNQNSEAEQLMKKIEKEEETVSLEEQDKKLFHLCIVNLVIGTLYCAKGNYEFGISRVMKSLEPYNKKLGTDTWYYAKRCFLSLFEQLAKQMPMVVLKDNTLQDCIQFFEHCEVYGRDIPTVLEPQFELQEMSPMPKAKETVTYEARYLKALFLKYQMS